MSSSWQLTGDRLDVLDFLRGIAVLGIFVINIESFAYADAFSAWQYGFLGDADRHSRFWTYFLFQGKFFSMFALLFGVGFYLFLERASRFGAAAVDLYAHRMFWLFVLGVVHSCLLWPGDILHHLAVCGLLLLPARSLVRWQLVAGALGLVFFLGWQSVSSTTRLLDQKAAYEAAVATEPAQRSEDQIKALERWETRYAPQSGKEPDANSPRLDGYASNVRFNLTSVGVSDGRIFYQGILYRTLLLMLVGIIFYRAGIFHDYRRLPAYWPIALGTLAIGLAANYSRHWAWTYEYFRPVTSYSVALAHHFSKELLGVAYILILNGVFQKHLGRLRSNPITKVGRMALTNYLAQSLFAGLIFYGYGIGLHGSLSRSQLWPLIIAIWILLLVLSALWLRRFRQGPAEALWRRLMYATALRGSDSGRNRDAH